MIFFFFFFFVVFFFFFFFFFFFTYLPSPNLGITPPGTYKPNARGSDACRGNNSLWIRALERYTRAVFPECVVSTISGPPPKKNRTNTDKGHTPNPRTEIKIPDPAGNRTWAAGLEGRDSTDHAPAMDPSYDHFYLNFGAFIRPTHRLAV